MFFRLHSDADLALSSFQKMVVKMLQRLAATACIVAVNLGAAA
ncbi:hypothetical protein HHS34_004680 [Acidithiobacillus montserratensis]|uniref:Uncharacterized protein n=1 Tax=Acidithiobacillus montserratensis TaxID=2729135 RepID=A0ACD5HHY9_9PROT|nr:hypothetical protein [Acidithiobacillus montserratensis]